MPTINVSPNSDEELQFIADTLGKSRKVVVVTGAGISTNCGIPDFRSEDGLYSLIQAQYDAALQNPPWETSNTFEIDDRPRKRAKPSYFYEVVAPDGRVVDVIHETPPSSQAAKQPEPEARPLRSRSTATPTSRPSTPSPDHENATNEPSEPPSSTPKIHQSSNESDEIHGQKTSETAEPKPPSRRSSRRARTQSDFTSVESSFVSTSSITVTEPSSTSPHKQSISTTITCSTNTSITTSTSEIRHVESQTRLQRQASSSVSKSEDEDPSATQSSQSSRTLPNLKGRDLFDSMIWNDPFTTSIFYMFISSLRNKVRNDVTSTTETHNFIKVLRDGGRLVRNYTQNIDLLEERLGLSTDLSRGVGNRARFHYRTQREPRPADVGGDSPHNGGVEVVLLHGSLGQLRCGICAKLSSWDDPEREAATLAGQAPDCPECEDHSNKRTGRGRRSLAVGRLRPDIVLYGEEHPSADLVGPLITHDLSLGPDVMLIMGTSLKVHGLKVMIKEFAKAIHTRGGKVVFINRTKPPESTWGDVIDYWVEWDCDAWVLDLKERREDIWLPQGARLEERDSSDDAKPGSFAAKNKPSRPQCIRDDKMNGAFVTFKILDTLGKFPDSKGKPAKRFPYWDKPAPRVSMPVQVAPVKKPAAKARKSLPAPAKGRSMTTSKKRKSCPSDLQKLQDQLAKREAELKNKMLEQWAEIRCRFPALPVLPRIRDPLTEIASNKVDMSGFHWSFHGGQNQFPDVGGNRGWSSEKLMLLSHPPSGALMPLHHSPKKVVQAPPAPPPVQTYSRPTNHAYKTRSSRRISNADTIVVDDTETRPPTWSAEEDTIVVAMDENENSKIRLPTPPESGTRTPSSQRIKRQSSISAILSDATDASSDLVFYDAQEQMI